MRSRYGRGMDATDRTLRTIGYEAFPTPEELRDALLAAGVERVCDVRAVPRSRRRGFSRRALHDLLADAGIVYEHWGELGNPAELREVFRAGRLEEGREAFRARLRDGLGWALDALADSLGERPTAMLCLEDDPALCHRGVIAEELVAGHPDVAVVRLGRPAARETP